MKKIVSLVVVSVMLVGMLFALTSCGKTLSGSYTDGLHITTYAFSGKKVTVTIDNLVGADTVIEGTYEITEDEDGKYITFTFEGEEDDEDYEGKHVLSEGTEDGKDYIKIDFVKYYKN